MIYKNTTLITMNKTIMILLALLPLSSMAQKMPNWVTNKPTPSNSTYEYVVEWATGTTELEARNQAIARVFQSTAMLIGQPYDSGEINRAVQRGTDYSVISATFNIPIKKVCEYADKKQSICRVYVLCQVAKAGNIRPIFDDFNACYEGNDKYYANEALYADGCDVYRNGKKLSDSEVRSMFANSKSYDLYDRGHRMGDDNVWMYGLGGCLMAPAIALLVIGIADWDTSYGRDYVVAGEVIGGLGVGLIMTGGIRSVVGKAKIRKAVNLYNNGKMYSQSEWEMEYGLTGNGAYFTLSF